MAATNYTPIQLYNSGTASAAPTNTNLAAGELALNYKDGLLYYKDDAGVVQKIGYKLVPVANGGTGATSSATAPFALKGANSDITSISTITGIGNTATTHLQISSAGAVTIPGTLAVTGGRSIFSAVNEPFALQVRYINTGGAVLFGATDATATPGMQISNSAGTSLISSTYAGAVTIPGPVGMGTTPNAGWAFYKVLQVGTGASFLGHQSAYSLATVGANHWIDGGGIFRYLGTDYASKYEQYQGGHSWLYAASGTAGNTFTWTTGMSLSNAGAVTIPGTLAVAGTLTGYDITPSQYGVLGGLYYSGGWKSRYSAGASLYAIATSGDSSGISTIYTAPVSTGVGAAASPVAAMAFSGTGAVTIPGVLSLTKDMSATAGGAITQQTSIAFTSPVNSWSQSFSQSVASYWKDSMGVVHLSGSMTGGTALSICQTLPAGYRPLAPNRVFPILTANGGVLGYCSIANNGEITVSNVGAIWLDGITFKAEN